jgi:hypothetical protein
MKLKEEKFTFRLSHSMLQQAKLKKLPLSHICRNAINSALANSEIFNENAAPLRSKKRSGQLWNKMSNAFVRTFPVEDWEKIRKSPFKLEVFRQVAYSKCPNGMLGHLGEFLDGGEYSEDILEIYLDSIDSKPVCQGFKESNEASVSLSGDSL